MSNRYLAEFWKTQMRKITENCLMVKMQSYGFSGTIRRCPRTALGFAHV